MRWRSWMVVACQLGVAGCHPPIEGDMPAGCTSRSRAPVASTSRVAWFASIQSGGITRVTESVTVEVLPNPQSSADGPAFVVPMTLQMDQSVGERACLWVVGGGSERLVAFSWDVAAGIGSQSDEVFFEVGRDPAAFDGIREVDLEAWIYEPSDRAIAWHALAKVRPVNREGYLSGN